MREVISVHVGQAGVQIGNACCMSFSLFIHNYAIVAAVTAECIQRTRPFRRYEICLKSPDADPIICRGTLHCRARS